MNASLIAIVGPTASGKTALAQYLSNVFAGEIVNADSRQIYKYLDIATAKPRPDEILTLPHTVYSSTLPVYKIKKIPHHLFDMVEPNEEFTVADYKKLALETISDIQCRSKLPILVGGTGLYSKAVVDNLQFPPLPPQKDVRAQLEKKNEGELYEILKKIDPLTAQSIDKYNKRRLTRALEVVLATGESFFGQTKKGPKLYETLQIAVDIPKEKLFQHIEIRTKKMIKMGLEKEVKSLVNQYGWNSLLSSTIGYREWQGYFEKEKNLEQVKDEIIKNTKLLVKKQLTWFLKQKEIHWVKSNQEAQNLISMFLA